MTSKEPSFSFGIEEEYYLVDRTSRALADEVPKPLMAVLQQKLGKQFSEEYMRSQVEISTPVCHDAAIAREHLSSYRRIIADEARAFNLAPIAAATHPFSLWRHQQHRNNARYNEIAEDFQVLGKRMVVCGQHVHIGIEDTEARIVVMNELRQYLPLLLALSTSSPFWGGEPTGLKSYRMAINDSTPRKGIPEPFHSWAHYQRSVDLLTGAGIIDDASKIWWDVRPSASFDTLEVRIMDVCPAVDDAIAISMLLRCLCRYIWRSHATAGATFPCPMVLINENRWRAQRYGLDEGLIDPATGTLAPMDAILDALLPPLAEDAAVFDCADELAHVRTILVRGTSADRQLALYTTAVERGQSREAALIEVVDQLIHETELARSAAPVAAPPQPIAEARI
jgi:glutamate---cysteine ligase / carboxylate-amine ligase